MMPATQAVHECSLDEPFDIPEFGIRVTIRHKHRGKYTHFAQRIEPARKAPSVAQCAVALPIVAKILDTGLKRRA